MVSRRQFLGGSLSRAPAARRPPWHRSEAAFTAACTRCAACVAACPTQIIVNGPSGFPQVDFRRGECTFCGDCVRACTPGALAGDPQAVPWSYRATIGDSCLTYRQTVCRSCGEACTAGAIRYSPVLGGAAEPLLDSGLCSGCGACVAPCPVQAISVAPRATLL